MITKRPLLVFFCHKSQPNIIWFISYYFLKICFVWRIAPGLLNSSQLMILISTHLWLIYGDDLLVVTADLTISWTLLWFYSHIKIWDFFHDRGYFCGSIFKVLIRLKLRLNSRISSVCGRASHSLPCIQ